MNKLFFFTFFNFRASYAFYTSLVTIFLWSVLSQKSNISFGQKINWVFVGLSEIEVNFWGFKTIIQSYLMRPLWHALICAHFSFLKENHRALELEENKRNLGSHNKSLFSDRAASKNRISVRIFLPKKPCSTHL